LVIYIIISCIYLLYSFSKISREELLKLISYKDNLKIYFKDFQKILLDFQILNREKYLRNFLLLFKKVDLDRNGVIKEEEFLQIINMTRVYSNMNKYDFNSHIARLLRLIDPFYQKQITFSDCVNLFSKVNLILICNK